MHMAMIGKMAKNWKIKLESPEKDAMQLPRLQKICRPLRNALLPDLQTKGFWSAAPELSEEEQAELQRKKSGGGGKTPQSYGEGASSEQK